MRESLADESIKGQEMVERARRLTHRNKVKLRALPQIILRTLENLCQLAPACGEADLPFQRQPYHIHLRFGNPQPVGGVPQISFAWQESLPLREWFGKKVGDGLLLGQPGWGDGD